MTDRRAILIVEDDEWWQEVLKEPLEDEGHEVIVVASYQDGHRALEQRVFDLAVLDLNLSESAPMLSGERLLARISRLYPHMPCIVVSGYGDARFVRDAFKQYHVVDYIAKDRFDIAAFVETTKTAVRSALAPGDLRRVLDARFDLEETKSLCLDLDIDFDSLRGEGKKAREVVAYCQRHGRLEELAAIIATSRPGAL